MRLKHSAHFLPISTNEQFVDELFVTLHTGFLLEARMLLDKLLTRQFYDLTVRGRWVRGPDALEKGIRTDAGNWHLPLPWECGGSPYPIALRLRNNEKQTVIVLLQVGQPIEICAKSAVVGADCGQATSR